MEIFQSPPFGDFSGGFRSFGTPRRTDGGCDTPTELWGKLSQSSVGFGENPPTGKTASVATLAIELARVYTVVEDVG